MLCKFYFEYPVSLNEKTYFFHVNTIQIDLEMSFKRLMSYEKSKHRSKHIEISRTFLEE